uniref:ABC transporter domain-containing protein n=1 Tax=Tetradesmus obliquus TaxID=3088 RepID=A0A383VMS4_TETOB|eukprot:jgi/Sobl393_1/15990/SZX66471.1
MLAQVGGSLPGGLMLRGLSGGERRRLSIAAGILAAPALLFLDEPTSGLDSFAALSVMSHLQGMARGSGCIVISTIHQPRDAIWEMFDKVTLLAGGRLMYHGPRTNISAWFASLGYPRLHGSESDWLLDLVATGFDKPQQLFGNAMMAREDIPAAADAFLAHYLQTTNKNQQDTAGEAVSIHKPPKRSASASSLSALRSCVGGSGSLQAMQPARWEYPTSLGRQFCSLLWREVLAITRNPFDLAGRILTCTYLGLVFGLVFYNTPADTLPGVRTRMSICFVIPMVATLLPSVSISLYTNDKRIYLADSSAKLYRPWAYYSSKVLATSPFNVFGILCMAWVLYGMAGLRPGWQPVLKAGIVSGLLYLIAMQAMHLCSVVAPNQDLTFCAFLIWLVINFAMSSFFVNFREVTTNVWLTQLRYISVLYYSLEALTVNEFHGSSISCSGGLEPGLAGLAESALASITPCQHAMLQQLTQPQESCLIRNDALLEYMQYGRPFGVSVAILGGYLAVVHLLTYAALVLLARHEAR